MKFKYDNTWRCLIVYDDDYQQIDVFNDISLYQAAIIINDKLSEERDNDEDVL